MDGKCIFLCIFIASQSAAMMITPANGVDSEKMMDIEFNCTDNFFPNLGNSTSQGFLDREYTATLLFEIFFSAAYPSFTRVVFVNFSPSETGKVTTLLQIAFNSTQAVPSSNQITSTIQSSLRILITLKIDPDSIIVTESTAVGSTTMSPRTPFEHLDSTSVVAMTAYVDLTAITTADVTAIHSSTQTKAKTSASATLPPTLSTSTSGEMLTLSEAMVTSLSGNAFRSTGLALTSAALALESTTETFRTPETTKTHKQITLTAPEVSLSSFNSAATSSATFKSTNKCMVLTTRTVRPSTPSSQLTEMSPSRGRILKSTLVTPSPSEQNTVMSQKADSTSSSYNSSSSASLEFTALPQPPPALKNTTIHNPGTLTKARITVSPIINQTVGKSLTKSEQVSTTTLQKTLSTSSESLPNNDSELLTTASLTIESFTSLSDLSTSDSKFTSAHQFSTELQNPNPNEHQLSTLIESTSSNLDESSKTTRPLTTPSQGSGHSPLSTSALTVTASESSFHSTSSSGTEMTTLGEDSTAGKTVTPTASQSTKFQSRSITQTSTFSEVTVEKTTTGGQILTMLPTAEFTLTSMASERLASAVSSSQSVRTSPSSMRSATNSPNAGQVTVILPQTTKFNLTSVPQSSTALENITVISTIPTSASVDKTVNATEMSPQAVGASTTQSRLSETSPASEAETITTPQNVNMTLTSSAVFPATLRTTQPIAVTEKYYSSAPASSDQSTSDSSFNSALYLSTNLQNPSEVQLTTLTGSSSSNLDESSNTTRRVTTPSQRLEHSPLTTNALTLTPLASSFQSTASSGTKMTTLGEDSTPGTTVTSIASQRTNFQSSSITLEITVGGTTTASTNNSNSTTVVFEEESTTSGRTALETSNAIFASTVAPSAPFKTTGDSKAFTTSSAGSSTLTPTTLQLPTTTSQVTFSTSDQVNSSVTLSSDPSKRMTVDPSKTPLATNFFKASISSAHLANTAGYNPGENRSVLIPAIPSTTAVNNTTVQKLESPNSGTVSGPATDNGQIPFTPHTFSSLALSPSASHSIDGNVTPPLSTPASPEATLEKAMTGEQILTELPTELTLSSATSERLSSQSVRTSPSSMTSATDSPNAGQVTVILPQTTKFNLTSVPQSSTALENITVISTIPTSASVDKTVNATEMSPQAVGASTTQSRLSETSPASEAETITTPQNVNMTLTSSAVFPATLRTTQRIAATEKYYSSAPASSDQSTSDSSFNSAFQFSINPQNHTEVQFTTLTGPSSSNLDESSNTTRRVTTPSQGSEHSPLTTSALTVTPLAPSFQNTASSGTEMTTLGEDSTPGTTVTSIASQRTNFQSSSITLEITVGGTTTASTSNSNSTTVILEEESTTSGRTALETSNAIFASTVSPSAPFETTGAIKAFTTSSAGSSTLMSTTAELPTTTSQVTFSTSDQVNSSVTLSSDPSERMTVDPSKTPLVTNVFEASTSSAEPATPTEYNPGENRSVLTSAIPSTTAVDNTTVQKPEMSMTSATDSPNAGQVTINLPQTTQFNLTSVPQSSTALKNMTVISTIPTSASEDKTVNATEMSPQAVGASTTQSRLSETSPASEAETITTPKNVNMTLTSSAVFPATLRTTQPIAVTEKFSSSTPAASDQSTSLSRNITEVVPSVPQSSPGLDPETETFTTPQSKSPTSTPMTATESQYTSASNATGSLTTGKQMDFTTKISTSTLKATSLPTFSVTPSLTTLGNHTDNNTDLLQSLTTRASLAETSTSAGKVTSPTVDHTSAVHTILQTSSVVKNHTDGQNPMSTTPQRTEFRATSDKSSSTIGPIAEQTSNIANTQSRSPFSPTNSTSSSKSPINISETTAIGETLATSSTQTATLKLVSTERSSETTIRTTDRTSHPGSLTSVPSVARTTHSMNFSSKAYGTTTINPLKKLTTEEASTSKAFSSVKTSLSDAPKALSSVSPANSTGVVTRITSPDTTPSVFVSQTHPVNTFRTSMGFLTRTSTTKTTPSPTDVQISSTSAVVRDLVFRSYDNFVIELLQANSNTYMVREELVIDQLFPVYKDKYVSFINITVDNFRDVYDKAIYSSIITYTQLAFDPSLVPSDQEIYDTLMSAAKSGAIDPLHIIPLNATSTNLSSGGLKFEARPCQSILLTLLVGMFTLFTSYC